MQSVDENIANPKLHKSLSQTDCLAQGVSQLQFQNQVEWFFMAGVSLEYLKGKCKIHKYITHTNGYVYYDWFAYTNDCSLHSVKPFLNSPRQNPID